MRLGVFLITSMFLLLSIFAIHAIASTPLFSEDFESDLALWANPGHGVLVQDPLDSGNQVVSFSATAAGGDMYTVPSAYADAAILDTHLP